MNFDAVVILSFGGPERPDDVMPFLRNVTRKRNVPDERLMTVAAQYDLFGGVSPLNEQCRSLVSALEAELAAHSIDLPVFWGNRNWEPYLTDTARQMAKAGVRNALVFATSAFSSYSGCRQYREDMGQATEELPDLTLTKLRLFYNHPGFIDTFAANVRAAFGPPPADTETRLIFTAHSIPLSMAATSEYEQQLHAAAKLVAEAAGVADDKWDLAFQSRSGPPSVPWLEPDINDHLRDVAAAGTPSVVVAPLGFLSDHMEVMFDLDTQAKQTADELGIGFKRVATVGTAARFVSMIRELIQERTEGAPRLALGELGPWPNECPEGHCALAQRPT